MSYEIYTKDGGTVCHMDLGDDFELQDYFLNVVHQDDHGYYPYNPWEEETGADVAEYMPYPVWNECASYICGEYNTGKHTFYSQLLGNGYTPSECEKIHAQADGAVDLFLGQFVGSAFDASSVFIDSGIEPADAARISKHKDMIEKAMAGGVEFERILEFVDDLDDIAATHAAGVPLSDIFA